MVLTVIQAQYRDGHRMLVTFNDGGESLVDLAGYLDGEVFEPLKDLTFFKQFAIRGNTVEWPNGADFAPEFLREIGHEIHAPHDMAARAAMVAEDPTEYRTKD